MADEIIIRPMVAEDRTGIDTYFDRLNPEATFLFNHEDCNRMRYHDYFEGKLTNFIPFVAEDTTNKRIAGVVFLSGSEYLIPLLGIGIDDAYTGRKLGVRMLQFIHDYAKSQGMGGIMLNVHPANLRAQQLYQKMGYKHWGTSLQGQMLYICRFTRDV